MYEKVFEQTERLFKPLNEIWALQAQTAETLARRQSSVFVDAWNQGVLALQNIPAQRNVEDVFKLQQEYWENLNGSVRELVEDTQSILLDTNQKITEILQGTAPNTEKAVTEAARNIADNAIATSKKVAPVAKKATTAATTAQSTVGAAVKAATSKTDGATASAIADKLGSSAKGDGEKKSASAKNITPPKTAAAPITEAKSEAKKPATSSNEDKAGKLL